MTNLNIPGEFSEKYILNPCLDFSCNSPKLSIFFVIFIIDDKQDDPSDMLRFSLKYHGMVTTEPKY